jgi:hypothetical protein
MTPGGLEPGRSRKPLVAQAARGFESVLLRWKFRVRRPSGSHSNYAA